MEAVLASLSWNLGRLNRTLSWPGWIGVVALACALATAVGSYGPKRAEIDQLQSERTKLGRAGAAALPGQPADPADPHAELAAFDGFLASGAGISAVMLGITEAAQANGVQLQRGEFKLVADTANGLGQYQMVFPVKSTYANVRGFLRQVLREHPQIALEEIGLRRDRPDSAELDARIRFALYLRLKP